MKTLPTLDEKMIFLHLSFLLYFSLTSSCMPLNDKPRFKIVDEIADEIRHCMVNTPKKGRGVAEYAMEVHANWSRLAKERETKLVDDLEVAKDFKIRLTPRRLIDELEAPFEDEYVQYWSVANSEKIKLDGRLIKLNKTITNLGTNMSQLVDDDPLKDEFQEKILNSTLEKERVQEIIEGLNFYVSSFPSDPTAHRIEQRFRRLYYGLKHRKSEQIEKLLEYIERDYEQRIQENTYSKSLDDFLKDFCKALAQAHEEGSILVPGVLRIEEEEEFEMIYFFNDPVIDRHLTTLVNALALRKPHKGPRFVLKKKRTDVNE